MFQVNNKDTITTQLESLNLNISIPSSNVSIVNFEHVIAGWGHVQITKPNEF